MGFVLKLVNGKIMKSKNNFYEESNEGFDAVMERMLKVVGNPVFGSYAMALDVNENTIKTWRRRGEVSIKYLKGFAAQHNVSLDYLMRGEKKPPEEVRAAVLTPAQERAGYSVEVLSKEEHAVLDNYRHCSDEVRQAIKAQADAMSKPKGKMRNAG